MAKEPRQVQLKSQVHTKQPIDALFPYLKQKSRGQIVFSGKS
jgi:hypothetical protein